MSRTPWFWILFVAASVSAGVFAFHFFPRAFSIISLDLKMDRAGALSSAKDLAAKHGWSPSGTFRQAATFGVDDTVKTFVELEGGGADAFRGMLAQHLYEAYTWRVRHFREGEARETLIRFTPTGAPYGFRERLKEDAAGASLPDDSARAIAEAAARDDWRMDLAPFTLVEHSKETHTGGRTDHTFVYERKGVTLGEGRYRLKLVVGGDRLTELTQFLRVPEAFDRRYENMRSANNAIATGASIAFVLLYLIGGCVIGVVLMLRQRWLIVRPALICGLIVAAMAAMNDINSWPLGWIGYDTALPMSTYTLQRVSFLVLSFVLTIGLLTMSFMAAEGLGRRAFPNHPQFWKLWSRDAGGSQQVVGRTAGGVLLTGIEFGYIIGFYTIAQSLWKWWVPSEAVVEPNILATYLPWVSAVAPSLQAGIWEESLFRAVPIAGAAILGERWGKRGLFIGIALVLEAVIFGSAHANYTGEPAFARPVELFVPSLIWGLVYLNFGLLPSIITHYLFDLILFALPLFTSSAAGSSVDRGMVIVCGLIPVGAIAVGLLRSRGLAQLPAALWNRAWTPPARGVEPPLEITAPVTAQAAMGAWRTRAILAAGLIGLVVWAIAGQFHADTPPIRIRRAQADAVGVDAAGKLGFKQAPRWKVLPTIDGEGGVRQAFVWRELGRQTYEQVIGRDLVPPSWHIRIASFSGDVAERAEEFIADVRGDGTLMRVRRQLPQDRAGASLDEAGARAIAERALHDRLQVEASALREVSALSSKLKNRIDWTFTYKDPAQPVLAKGERRIAVVVSGDQATDAYRFVFVPEDWERSYRGTRGLLQVFRIVRNLLIALIVVSAASLTIMAWTRGAFPVGFALRFFAIYAVLGWVAAFNNWPGVEAGLSTAQPYNLQVTITGIVIGLVYLVISALMAVLAGGANLQLGGTGSSAQRRAMMGIAAGALVAGIVTLLQRVGGDPAPRWGAVNAAETTLPLLGEPLSAATSLLLRGSILLAMLVLVHEFTAGWTKRQVLMGALLVLIGGVAVSPATAETPLSWLAQCGASGVLLLLLYVFVLRYELAMVPWMLATMLVLTAIKNILIGAHPDAVVGSGLSILLLIGVAAWWSNGLVGRAKLSSAPATAAAS